MRRIKIVHYAVLNEVFLPRSFDNNVSKPILVRVGDEARHGTLAGAVVTEDGRSVELTVDIEEVEDGKR